MRASPVDISGAVVAQVAHQTYWEDFRRYGWAGSCTLGRNGLFAGSLPP